jgi:predicted nucleotidyltransferase
MLSSSNPTVIEWLRSDILYYGEINKIFKKYAEKSFKKISIYFHYKSMCKQNYLKYIKSRDDLSYKRYLYAMRGLINAKYVAKFGKLPPISFPKTINESKELIPDYVYKKLINILELKKQCKEKDIIQNIVCMDSYIESVLGDDKDAPKEKQLTPKTELDNELRKIVLTFG